MLQPRRVKVSIMYSWLTGGHREALSTHWKWLNGDFTNRCTPWCCFFSWLKKRNHKWNFKINTAFCGFLLRMKSCLNQPLNECLHFNVKLVGYLCIIQTLDECRVAALFSTTFCSELETKSPIYPFMVFKEVNLALCSICKMYRNTVHLCIYCQ